MDADVRRDVVALDGCGAALIPLAGEVQVVGALATDMLFADVLLGSVRINSEGYFSFFFFFFII